MRGGGNPGDMVVKEVELCGGLRLVEVAKGKASQMLILGPGPKPERPAVLGSFVLPGESTAFSNFMYRLCQAKGNGIGS